jgi:hypothetical protein
MEMLDRYLLAVRRHLPWLRQDDIIAELRANLEAQLDDKQAELGRKLTSAEMEAWLKELGSPLQVAARYRPQQYLIGPALFPAYWFVLRLATGWCAVLYAIAEIAEIAVNGLRPGALAGAVAKLPWVMFISAAIVTLLFAILERSGAKIPAKFAQGAAIDNNWPHPTVPPFDARHDGQKKPKTYAQAVAEVIFGCILIVWLLLVPHYPYLLMGPGVVILKVAPYQLAPMWWTFYWCIVALNVIELAWRIIDLLRDRWQVANRARKLAIQFLGLVPLLIVLAAPGGTLVMLKNPADTEHAAALTQLNQWAYRGCEMIAALVILQLVWLVVRTTIEAHRRRLAAP